MLQYYISKNAIETTEMAVDQMTWSILRRHLKTFLDTTWIEGHQLIVFRHSSLEQVPKKFLLKYIIFIS